MDGGAPCEIADYAELGLIHAANGHGRKGYTQYGGGARTHGNDGRCILPFYIDINGKVEGKGGDNYEEYGKKTSKNEGFLMSYKGF